MTCYDLPPQIKLHSQCIPVVAWPQQHQRNRSHGAHHGQHHEAEELEVVPGRGRERDDEERHEGQPQQLVVGGGHLWGGNFDLIF